MRRCVLELNIKVLPFNRNTAIDDRREDEPVGLVRFQEGIWIAEKLRTLRFSA